jgi:hypothetical protein
MSEPRGTIMNMNGATSAADDDPLDGVVRPSHAARSRGLRNVPGGGASTAKTATIRGPISGTVISRRATRFS